MYNLIFVFHGFLAILTQLVIFRELSVLFYGSELFLGTFLSSWLLWVGLGSIAARRVAKKEALVPAYFSYGFLALSLALPLFILIIRASKNVFSFGEFIGPLATLLYTFAIMGFLCLVIGIQFSLACAIATAQIKKEAALGRVYLCEALGSVFGGVLFTYALIGFMPTFIIALMLSLGCVLACMLIAEKKAFKTGLLTAIALAALFAYFKIEPAVNRFQWKRYQLLQQKEARNATLSVVGLGSITNVFVDGMLSASFPNPESYEPAAHWPLLATAEPRRILVVGDLSLGTLKEALKHNPRSLDFIVLDHSILDALSPYLDAGDAAALRDPRVVIHYGDARLFLKEKKNTYDTVIINIQEDPNLKLNRFYTQEFYRQIKSALVPNGVLASSAVSSENYLSGQTRMFNASVYRTLQSVFDTTEAIPGDSITFLSSPSAIDMRKETMLERYNNRKIANRFFTPAYIDYKLIADRRAALKNLLSQTPNIKINRDFRPTSYYYFTNFWLNKLASPLWYLATIILIVAAGFIVFKKRASLAAAYKNKECVLIFTLGFMSMLLELILLLSFQVISGYVYWQMGILFAAFMSGLCCGTAAGIRFHERAPKALLNFVVALMVAIIGLSAGVGYLLPQLINVSTLMSIIIFLSLLASIGAVVGAAFVGAGLLMKTREIMQKAGSLYAADLWGAAGGAMLSTNFIIPLLGLVGALYFSAFAGMAGLAAFLMLAKKK